MEHTIIGTKVDHVTPCHMFLVEFKISGVLVGEMVSFRRPGYKSRGRMDDITQSPCLAAGFLGDRTASQFSTSVNGVLDSVIVNIFAWIIGCKFAVTKWFVNLFSPYPFYELVEFGVVSYIKITDKRVSWFNRRTGIELRVVHGWNKVQYFIWVDNTVIIKIIPCKNIPVLQAAWKIPMTVNDPAIYINHQAWIW